MAGMECRTASSKGTITIHKKTPHLSSVAIVRPGLSIIIRSARVEILLRPLILVALFFTIAGLRAVAIGLSEVGSTLCRIASTIERRELK